VLYVFAPFCSLTTENGVRKTDATYPPHLSSINPRTPTGLRIYPRPCQEQTTDDPGGKETGSQGTVATPSLTDSSGNNLQNSNLVSVENKISRLTGCERLRSPVPSPPQWGSGQGRQMQGTTMTAWGPCGTEGYIRNRSTSPRRHANDTFSTRQGVDVEGRFVGGKE